MTQLASESGPSDREARLLVWRRRLMVLMRDPELAAAIDTLADLTDPTSTFEEDEAKHRGVDAIADDYLQSGHFSHCSLCFQSVARYPSHVLDFPQLTPHECTEREVGAGVRQSRREKPAPAQRVLRPRRVVEL